MRVCYASVSFQGVLCAFAPKASHIITNKCEPYARAGSRWSPFGGYKQSGNGREWGGYAFHDFLEVKGVVGFGEA